MTMSSRDGFKARLRVSCALVALCLSLPVVGGPIAAAQAESSPNELKAAIEKRDGLIASQESLLNAYRCLFDVDTHIVPGGCTDGKPAEGPTPPTVYRGEPTRNEVAIRDQLIIQQESLLNIYRCLFDVDTHIVPGGCANSQPPIRDTGQPTADESVDVWTNIDTGRGHSCALKTNGTIECWGNNGDGQAEPHSGQFAAIASGEAHSCGLKTSGVITCWGNNRSRQAKAPNGLFSAVAAGSGHSCGLKVDATVACWGQYVTPSTIRRVNSPTGQFTAVSAGFAHSCGLRVDRTIECWGWDNFFGQNLYGQMEAPDGSFDAISTGDHHSCGLRVDRTIECWGWNYFGQLNAPNGQFDAVSAGGSHSCGLRINQTVVCWGNNRDGQSESPPGKFISISAGWNHSCGIRMDNTIDCWNAPDAMESPLVNTSVSAHGGELEVSWIAPHWDPDVTGYDIQYRAEASGYWADWPHRGTDTKAYITGLRENDVYEVRVRLTNSDGKGLWSLSSVSRTASPASDTSLLLASVSQHSTVTAEIGHFCQLQSDQTIACHFTGWGGENRVIVPGGRFLSVSAGGRHSCGLRVGQTVECWGSNSSGQLSAPDGRFLSVSAGGDHSCGLRVGQTVECWGSNSSGQLSAPDGRFLSVSAGGDHSCGLRVGQTVECWGSNSYRQADAPVGKFLRVSAGANHSCGLRENQTIECWSWFSRLEAPSDRYVDVSTGYNYACGLRVDRTAVCWGPSGVVVPNTVPEVPNETFLDIDVGFNYACGVKTDNSLRCWGRHSYPAMGERNIYVFYCASTSEGYTASDLQSEVDLFNETVAKFYTTQSSGLVNLHFLAGGIISPRINWENPESKDTLSNFQNPCVVDINTIRRFQDYADVLILIGAWPTGGNGAQVSGFAPLGGDHAVAVTVELTFAALCQNIQRTHRVRDLTGHCRNQAFSSYHSTIAHELGHSLFRIGHPNDGSVMAPGGARSLNTGHIGCAIRKSLGWPCE